MKPQTKKKTRRRIKYLAAGLFGVLSLAGLGVYEHYLPPTRTYRKAKKAKYPYALLLGCPNRKDGTNSRSQIKRCTLAILAWKEGLYDKLIISGGAVKNQYIESEEMAKYIHEREPELPILLESKAANTWQNMEYARDIVKNEPVLIITGSLHARRASAMAKNFFKDYALLYYPDHKPRHILREIPSRAVYIQLEVGKDFKKLLNDLGVEPDQHPEPEDFYEFEEDIQQS